MEDFFVEGLSIDVNVLGKVLHEFGAALLRDHVAVRAAHQLAVATTVSHGGRLVTRCGLGFVDELGSSANCMR